MNGAGALLGYAGDVLAPAVRMGREYGPVAQSS